MKITNQRLQQLIRESIFKRMFGKKEKTKADIPDEIASDFGGGSEDVVDDFNAEEDDSDDNEGLKIKRRGLAKAAVAGATLAGLEKSGVGPSNLFRQSSESYSGITMEVHVEMYSISISKETGPLQNWEDIFNFEERKRHEKSNDQEFILPIELPPELVEKVIGSYRRMESDLNKLVENCYDLLNFINQQVENQIGEFGEDEIYYQYELRDVIGSAELEEALYTASEYMQ